MTNTATRETIESALQDFSKKNLRDNALRLFKTLGYESNRTIKIGSVADFSEHFDPEKKLDHPTAFREQWKSVELLFQITDTELSQALDSKNSVVSSNNLKSYIFFAVDLYEKNYSRSTLASITRRINQVFHMPVLVLYRYSDRISIAVINRRISKREESKDVLGKVSIIYNVSTTQPHAGHIAIIESFSIRELVEAHGAIHSFDDLHAAWEEVFNVELLNKRFYEEISNWFFWARSQVEFPADLEPDNEKRNSMSVITLLTRLIFCWFLKEKDLVPQNLFEKAEISQHLKSLKDDDDNYYRAVLQNLFFATLNQKMDKKLRQFAEDQTSSSRIKEEGGVKNLYRYQEEFVDPEAALGLFANVPFLNGGLFACLDHEVKKGKVLYADGFTRDKRKMAHVPNFLFFSGQQTVDLSADYGQNQKKNAHVNGLLNILKRYKFTIAENTPVEQEIALDPELLGKVFENLLASYNPETCTTARTATGSFYTPRSIVDYMVDESLKSYFFNALHAAFPGTSGQFFEKELAELLSYGDQTTNLSIDQIDVLVRSIDACNILDPACGSGAFPMGILHKLVHVLKKLDSENTIWKRIQLEKAEGNDKHTKVIENNFSQKNELDYARKLYLIANSIYGIDIQPIAIQISKLRFFISLICDQKVSGNKAENRGIQPLPNLETRFVAANALIELSKNNQLSVFHNPRIQYLGRLLEQIRHDYFSAQDRKDKLEQDDEDKRNEIIAELDQRSISDDVRLRANWKKIAQWNPYDHFDAAGFFEPTWMFGKAVSGGFDIIIGNPPYIKEDINKSAFSGVKESECYQGKMDLWYLFGARALDILKPGGTLAYIATNNWTTNDGASKFRNKLLKEAQLLSFIDFGNYKIFSAGVQTMILIAQKSSENKRYSVNYGRVHNDKITRAQLAEFLTAEFNISNQDYEKYCVSDFLRDDYIDSYINFVPPKIQSVLTKMRSANAIYLKERTEIFSGIDILQDFVSKKHIPRLKIKSEVGDGIFVLNEQEKNSVQWNQAELEKLKPYYRPKEIHRYFAEEHNQLWLIYTGASDNRSIGSLPNIKRHLDKFQPVLTSVNKPYGLHRQRDENNFLGSKILCVRKCQRPAFSLVSFPAYVGRTFMLIKTAKLDLWALLAILNSKLITFWLIFKGKRQGNQFQVDSVPLQQIPIALPNSDAVQKLKTLAQSRMQVSDNADGKAIEQKIDALVFEIYKLTATEIETVETIVSSLVQEDSDDGAEELDEDED